MTDVHTDPPRLFVGDPGCILHEGVGAVQLLMVAVNWGPGDAAVYAGPVMSHYEFELGPTTRQTDSEWKAQIRAAMPHRRPIGPAAIGFPGHPHSRRRRLFDLRLNEFSQVRVPSVAG